MKIIDKIKSKEDSTVKFIFKLNNDLIVESSYINKNDGKEIICVSTQTSCSMGCKFCHITSYRNVLINQDLTNDEIFEMVKNIIDDLNLKNKDKVLLISYMGCGEPLLNIDNVLNSMINIRDNYTKDFKLVRFGLATSLPKILSDNTLNNFIKNINDNKILYTSSKKKTQKSLASVMNLTKK